MLQDSYIVLTKVSVLDLNVVKFYVHRSLITSWWVTIIICDQILENLPSTYK